MAKQRAVPGITAAEISQHKETGTPANSLREGQAGSRAAITPGLVKKWTELAKLCPADLGRPPADGQRPDWVQNLFDVKDLATGKQPPAPGK
jgi:hypothetical protein